MPPASASPPIAVGNDSASGIGYGFGARDYRPSPPNKNQSQQNQPPSRPATSNRRENRPDKSKLWCSHCGMQNHTRETCFQLVEYPEWWDEERQTKRKMAIGIKGGGRFPTGIGAGSQEAANTQENGLESGNLQTDGRQARRKRGEDGQGNGCLSLDQWRRGWR